MKTAIQLLLLFSFASIQAQVSPMLDYTWTIEKIETEGETIMADINPFGEYDQFSLGEPFELDETNFYDFFFGNCQSYLSFEDEDDSQTLYFYLLGCTLSEDSSAIATYFNFNFVIENTVEVIMENDFFPEARGPSDYDFRDEGDVIYLDITNSIGEVATFWASTLSTSTFDENSISIFPNPVQNQLHIQSKDAAVQQLEIFSLSGKKVLESAYHSNQAIDVSKLAKGMYFIKGYTENGSFTKKLLKK